MRSHLCTSFEHNTVQHSEATKQWSWIVVHAKCSSVLRSYVYSRGTCVLMSTTFIVWLCCSTYTSARVLIGLRSGSPAQHHRYLFTHTKNQQPLSVRYESGCGWCSPVYRLRSIASRQHGFRLNYNYAVDCWIDDYDAMLLDCSVLERIVVLHFL